MVDVGVVKAVDDGSSKGTELFLRQIKGRDYLLEHGLFQEAADRFILHAVSHDVLAAKIRAEDHGGMSAVEDAYLALLIGRHVVHHLNGESRLLEGKLVPDGLRPLNDPGREDLSGVDELVLISQLFPEARRVRLRRAGDNPVHQSRAEDILCFKPRGKAVLQCPELYIFIDAAAEFLAVVIDKLTGEDDDAGKAQLPALMQEKREFRGESGRRRILRPAGRVKGDPRLRRIGDYEA